MFYFSEDMWVDRPRCIGYWLAGLSFAPHQICSGKDMENVAHPAIIAEISLTFSIDIPLHR